MLTTGRLASLTSLNFSSIAPADRANAEMFYLSRIARQLAAVPAADEPAVMARHPRFAALCAAYGAPDVVRRAGPDADPALLEARLVRVAFAFADRRRSADVPRSLDMYAVKALAGRPVRPAAAAPGLVWETGEWDPVAGFDESGAPGDGGRE